MNTYINEYIKYDKKKLLNAKEQIINDEIEPILCIILGFIIICLIILISTEAVYTYIFDGIDYINYTFKEAGHFICNTVSYLHLDKIGEQITQIF